MRRSARLFAAATAAAVVLTLGACGSDDSGDDPVLESPAATASATTTGSASGSPTSSPTDDGTKVIEVTMTGSKVEPPPGNVKVDKGAPVRIVITRDTPGEVHVHGYDEEAQAKAGEPVTFEFVADQVGIFEVEAHDPDRLLFKLQVS